MVKPNSEDVCPAPATPPSPSARIVIPEIQETVEISTREIETGTVRITKQVHEVERTFHPTLQEQHVRIERIPINRVVKTPPEVRTEGDTTIIPVVEEVLVKLMLLKEELHVTRQTLTKPAEPQHVTLKREEVSVDRLAPAAPTQP